MSYHDVMYPTRVQQQVTVSPPPKQNGQLSNWKMMTAGRKSGVGVWGPVGGGKVREKERTWLFSERSLTKYPPDTSIPQNQRGQEGGKKVRWG